MKVWYVNLKDVAINMKLVVTDMKVVEADMKDLYQLLKLSTINMKL